MMIKMILAWLTAIALAAMPVAAWATPPCPMASGQMTAMAQADGAPMQKDCHHKPAKSCVEICAAMTVVVVYLPETLVIAVPVLTGSQAFALPMATLVARHPAGLDRPPRSIA